MRATAIAAALAALLVGPATGLGVPSLSEPVLSPNSWSSRTTAGAFWAQNDFGSGLAGPAVVQINGAADGTVSGPWVTVANVQGPLQTGSSGVFAIDVSGLEGQHRLRVVIDGAMGSPLDLGVLQLDRTPPSLSSVLLTPEGGTIVADWIQSDALSGTDPAQPVVVEVNADPAGGAGGEWAPFARQPDPGDGRKVARTDLAGLPDGRHLVRARTRDRAGNAAEPVLGTVLADHTPPVVTDVRVARQAGGPTGIAEIAYTAVDPSPGVGLAGAPAPRVG